MFFKSYKEREDFINKNKKLATKVLYSLRQNKGYYPHTDEDMKQIAYILLIEAVDKYDSSYGTAFSTFAWKHIKNRLLNEITKCTKQNEKFQTFGDEKEINNIEDDRNYEQQKYSDYISKQTLNKVLQFLSERELYIIKEHVLNNRTFQSIAEELKISKQRVCQINNQALNKAKTHLDKLNII